MEWWIWSLMWISTTRTAPRPEIVEAFETRQIVIGQKSVHYRFFRPTERPMEDSRPLLVWLHGLGEAGENNRDQLAWLELILGRDPRQYGAHSFCILATQCSARQPTWVGADSALDDPLAQTSIILHETLRTEPIDRRRVYLAGVSTGASGAWELARRHPNLFAGVLLFAPTAIDLRGVSSLTETPVWAFLSLADGPATRKSTARMIDAVRSVGGRAHLTMIDAPDHDCWTAGFREHRAWAWLMAQRRGSPFSPLPGYPPMPFRSVAVLCAFVSAWLFWRRRRLP